MRIPRSGRALRWFPGIHFGAALPEPRASVAAIRSNFCSWSSQIRVRLGNVDMGSDRPPSRASPSQGTHWFGSRFFLEAPPGSRTMDKERVKGMADQAKGSVKETAGKMTGDQKLKTEG